MPNPFLINANIPAYSAAFCKKNAITLSAQGSVDTSSSDTVYYTTLFQAASLSKTVSAAIVLEFFKHNNWDLNTPISQLFDYCPETLNNNPDYELLTTRMILSQCSGLPNWYSGPNPLKFIAKPGTQFTYSGLAFDYLKDAILYKTKIRWETLAQLFFKKAGMENSTFLHPSKGHLKGRTLAQGHEGDGRPAQFQPEENALEIPAASLFTTAEDYIIFMKYCHADEFLNQHLFVAQTHLNVGKFSTMSNDDIRKIKWGLGFGLYEDRDRKIAFHWGSNPGSLSFAAIDVKKGYCVATFVNSNNGPNVFKHITQAIVGDISPVFNWLENYCGFTAVVKSNDQQLGSSLLLMFSKNCDQNTGPVNTKQELSNSSSVCTPSK